MSLLGMSPGVAAAFRDPPFVERTTRYQHLNFVVGGPLLVNRLGLTTALSWTDLSYLVRRRPPLLRNRLGSGFAHAIWKATPVDAVRSLLVVQHVSTTEFTDTAEHAQSTWERSDCGSMFLQRMPRIAPAAAPLSISNRSPVCSVSREAGTNTSLADMAAINACRRASLFGTA